MSRLRLTKISTPSNPPTNTAEIFYSTADSKLEAVDQTGNILKLGGFGTLDYRIIKVTTVLQGTTTYTPSTGIRALFVEAIGAGGQGGGVATAATNAGAGGGGGAGAYSAVFLTTVKASYAVVVGLGGSTSGTGATTGQTGTDTTFDSPSVCTAKGGAGGVGDTVAAGPRVAGVGGAGGVASSGVGDYKADGTAGGAGLALAAAQAASGVGAMGFNGGGSISKTTQGTGVVGGLYGGGGSGGCILSGGASVAGGAGANGLLIIWELA